LLIKKTGCTFSIKIKDKTICQPRRKPDQLAV